MFTAASKLVTATAGLALVLIVGCGAIFGPLALSFGINAGSFYTQVDNSSMRIVESDDEMDCEYRLAAYNEQGERIDATFLTSRKLKENAYLMLDVKPFRGVVSWEEVQPDDVPSQARTRLALVD